tara:strand:+ start:22709 stop:23620 length:912 start_codon:yes stop_codon:yes gene_type:complete
MSNLADNNTNVLITGSSGLIGSALIPLLEAHGYAIHRLTRSPNPSSPYWNIETREIHLNGAPNPDIIIHLAGENIAKARWSKSVKQKITNSRLQSTKILVDFINNNPTPAKLFICASAIGFYGNRGQQPVDEDSLKGNDFVSELADQWEQISNQVKHPNTRIVNLRTGIVLSKKDGALAKMLPPFKMGLGGRIGSGKQIMSWIDLEDELKAILFIMQQPQLTGPVNLVSPHPIDNQTFSIILASTLRRPCIFPFPALMVKLLFAQMGEELLLSSTNVRPTKLLKAGFKFKYELLEDSLNHQLR